MIKCNRKRLQKNIELFSPCGRPTNHGVTRMALSPEDLQARSKFKEICEEIGLSVITNDMASMYATLPGKKSLSPLVIG